jgi:hypothetical protein
VVVETKLEAGPSLIPVVDTSFVKRLMPNADFDGQFSRGERSRERASANYNGTGESSSLWKGIGNLTLYF